MKSTIKRLFSLLLVLTLALTLCPLPAHAAELSGQCGPDAYWRFADGTLTIYGTGPMDNYNPMQGTHAPWKQAGLIAEEGGVINTLVIEPGITTIGDYAFYYVWFPNASIPNTVTSIGDFAFSDNKTLSAITIPESVTYIGRGAFYGCASLTSANIHANITELGLEVFATCQYLQNVQFPSTLTTIGPSSFGGCGCAGNDPAPLVIPEGVTAIDRYAFSGCGNFAPITLPTTLETIGAYAFSGHSTLSEIVIPENVRLIDTCAFDSCTQLEKITFLGDAPEINILAFTDVSAEAYYPADKNWPDSIFQIFDNLTWIPYGEGADTVTKPGLEGTWYTDIILPAADLGVEGPDACLRAAFVFTEDGQASVVWEAVSLNALRLYFHQMFTTAYYALAYGMGITDLEQIEQFCQDSTGMSVSAYMDTIVTQEAIDAAFTPESSSGAYRYNPTMTGIYTDLTIMGIPSDPNVQSNFEVLEDILFLTASSWGKSSYIFVCFNDPSSRLEMS